jgi:exodeoxyribonuclease VII small subunit
MIMTDKDKNSDITQLTFEQAITQLSDIVEKIEQGQIPLAESLAQYEDGMALIKQCRSLLTVAERRIEKISQQEKPAQ